MYNLYRCIGYTARSLGELWWVLTSRGRGLRGIDYTLRFKNIRRTPSVIWKCTSKGIDDIVGKKIPIEYTRLIKKNCNIIKSQLLISSRWKQFCVEKNPWNNTAAPLISIGFNQNRNLLKTIVIQHTNFQSE